MPTISEISRFLDDKLGQNRFPDEPPSIFLPSTRDVYRLGLALEPSPELIKWVIKKQLDAVFLHRPWRLDLQQWPQGIGILMSHQPFDDRLTLGENSRLAQEMGFTHYEPFGEKNGHTLGMIGDIVPQEISQFLTQLKEIFGGWEEMSVNDVSEIKRIAVVNAMTDALVRQASENGAKLYITGQRRASAQNAVLETGIGVVAIGHRRSEVWGLHALATIIEEKWPQMTKTIIFDAKQV